MHSNRTKYITLLLAAAAASCAIAQTASADTLTDIAPDSVSVSTPDTPDTADKADTADTSDTPATADTADTADTPDTADEPKDPLTEIPSPLAGLPDEQKTRSDGDVDSDGEITANDALSALRMPVFGDATPAEGERADVDRDGTITSADALEILRRSSGLSVSDMITDVRWYKDESGAVFAKSPDGKLITGIANIDGFICGFDENGALITGEREENGERSVFTENGVLVSGFRTTNDGIKLYRNGVEADGWVEAYSKTFYFENGLAYGGWKVFEDKLCYFEEYGEAAVGFREIDGDLFCFGSDFDKLTGLVNVGGKYYLLLPGGGFATGFNTVGDETYYFNPDGTAATGWVTDGGNKYYFIKENKFATGTETIDGKVYAFSGDGKMLLGWYEDGSVTRYLTEDGAAVGIYTVDGEDYFFEYYDAALHIGFVMIDGKVYYNNDHGFANTGFMAIDGDIYHFGSDGVMSVGKTDIDGLGYTFADNGKMTEGWYEKSSNRAYMRDGKTVTGDVNIGGTNYHFEPDGTLRTGLYNDGTDLYYKNDFGFNMTGWQTVGENKYYFTQSGAAASGFVTLDGTLYCFDETSHIMLTNTTVGMYRVAANGACYKLTTVDASTVKYKADDIIASVGSAASSLCYYVHTHVGYYFINEPMVYSNPWAADWARIAAFAANRGYGACYHYAALLDVLFERAGFTHRIVVGTGYYTSLHCFNQIYVNGQWLTYDALYNTCAASTGYMQSIGYTYNNFVTASY